MEHFESNGQVPEINNFEEDGPGCRTRNRHLNPTCCPVCGESLRQTEIGTHLRMELDKLNKLYISKINVNGESTPSCSNSGSSDSTSDPDEIRENFKKDTNNYQNRLRRKTGSRKAEQLCPLCNKNIIEDLQTHVESCLRRSEENGSEHEEENIDIESVEEYECRIRATSLLSGGVSSLGQPLQNVDEDEEVNVDGDDELHGLPQFSERDIILPSVESTQDLALRRAVMGGNEPNFSISDGNDGSIIAGDARCKSFPVLEVLKNRINELEKRIECKDEIYKCSVCMGPYQTPVISVCCWHVHCKQCWLQTLGAKKVCPQCNIITSAADLRKIFM